MPPSRAMRITSRAGCFPIMAASRSAVWAWSSCDGSYAVTQGQWRSANASGGFVTVWQRQGDPRGAVHHVLAEHEGGKMHDVTHALLESDYYQLLADYGDYVATQQRVDDLYRRPSEWARQAILNIAAMGPFSSDRTIREYARDIWGAVPVPVP